MDIVAIGLNHQTSPIALRDQVALASGQIGEALDSLRTVVGRGVILSTCNRMEIYTLAPSEDEGARTLKRFVSNYHDVALDELTPHIYTYSQREAVHHLFQVSCGLDSLVLGESQILGQVREAYGSASRMGMAGGSLSRLFHQALRVGKRARRETDIGRNALSISRAAVELARRTLGDLANCRVLVIGIGDAGKLAARALADAGATHIVVTNRTYSRATDLAAELGGSVEPFEELGRLLGQTDIAITATGAPSYIVTPELLMQARVASDGPLFLIDIASPRDVDPSAKEVPGVHLFDIDDLETVAETNRRQREKEAEKVEAIVDEEVDRFMDWLRSLDVVPTVAAIHKSAEAVRGRELSKAIKRLSGLSEEDRAALDAFSKALMKKLLHRPISSLKEKRNPYYTQAAHDLFALEDDS